MPSFHCPDCAALFEAEMPGPGGTVACPGCNRQMIAMFSVMPEETGGSAAPADERAIRLDHEEDGRES